MERGHIKSTRLCTTSRAVQKGSSSQINCLICLRLTTYKAMMMDVDVKMRTIFMLLSFCNRLAYSQMFDYSSILKQALPKDECDFFLVSHSGIELGKNPY